MTLHLGKVKPGSTIYIPFDTFAGSTGASVTMTGLAVTDVEIYKNGSVTQRASDTGYTLLDTDGIDFDGLTGIHGFSVDLSSNADAGFFVAGGFYWVVVSAITVDSQTVSFVAATFTLGYEGALLDTTIATLSTQTSFTLTAGPAEDDALNGCEVVIHDIASAVQAGRAIVSDYTGSTKTVTLVAGTTFTAAAGDNISVFLSALQPTVQGRALDVSTGGEAGVDWANVGTPGSTVALSATTVATVTTTTTATNVTTVNGLAANVITAASIATGAIDADAIADNAIDAGAIAADAITAAKIADGAIDAATFAAGAITASAIAADAIGASELAADAIAEIADAVWDEDATAHQTQGTFGQAIGDPAADTDTLYALANTIAANIGTPAGASLAADIAAIEAQTDDIGAAGAGLTAVPWNAAWDAEVQSEVDDALVAQNLDHLVKSAVDTNFETTVHLDSVLGQMADNGTTATFDRTTDSLEALANGSTPPTAAAIADAVWDETLSGHLGVGSTGEALNAAGAAGDPWTTALPGAYGSGSAGHIIGNRLVGTIASGTHNPQSGDAYARLGAPAGASVSADIADLPTNAELATSQAAADDATLAAIAALNNLSAAQVNAEVDTALADVNLDHLVGTATGIPAIPAGTYLDQIVDDGTAAFDRTTDSLQAIRDRGDAAWDTADVSALALEATAQSILTDTAEIGTAGAGLTNINLPNQTMDIVGNITGNLSGSVGSVTGAVGSVTAGVTVTTNNDKTGYALSSAGVDAILDDAVEGAYTFRQFLRLFAASLGGKLSGAATTTVTIRNVSDSKNVVVATVDADGNRSAVTLDLT